MSPEKAVAFAAIHQAVWGLYMGCTFAPNHKAMALVAAGDNLDFLRRQVLTSRNVRGGVITDLALGGLNYQIEHHLFPNVLECKAAGHLSPRGPEALHFVAGR